MVPYRVVGVFVVGTMLLFGAVMKLTAHAGTDVQISAFAAAFAVCAVVAIVGELYYHFRGNSGRKEAVR
jgi:uncharacterized membrane protein